MSFGSPLWLLTLLLLPVLVFGYVLHERRRVRKAAAFGNPALFPNVVARSPGRLRHLPIAVLLVALAALVVGVARPRATVSVPREEATIIVAVDISRSMTATDVRPSRFAAARGAAEAFLDRVPAKYRVALVSFGSRAVLAVPPTQDRELFRSVFQTLHTGEGTALGDAIALSAQTVREQRTSDGAAVPPAALVVISDGAREGGQTTVDGAIRRARRAHLPVYTVLVGTKNASVTAPLTGGYKVIVQVPASPETLQLVARETGGRFYAAPDANQLRTVYEKLGSQLGKRKTSREVTDFVAAGSALLILGGTALSLLWFGRAL